MRISGSFFIAPRNSHYGVTGGSFDSHCQMMMGFNVIPASAMPIRRF